MAPPPPTPYFSSFCSFLAALPVPCLAIDTFPRRLISLPLICGLPMRLFCFHLNFPSIGSLFFFPPLPSLPRVPLSLYLYAAPFGNTSLIHTLLHLPFRSRTIHAERAKTGVTCGGGGGKYSAALVQSWLKCHIRYEGGAKSSGNRWLKIPRIWILCRLINLGFIVSFSDSNSQLVLPNLQDMIPFHFIGPSVHVFIC